MARRILLAALALLTMGMFATSAQALTRPGAVVRSAVDEAAAYGAALQARWAVACEGTGGQASLPEVAADWAAAMQEATTQEPNPEAVRRYDETYAVFRRLTEGLKPMFEMTPHV